MINQIISGDLLPYLRWQSSRRRYFALLGISSAIMFLWTIGLLFIYGVGTIQGDMSNIFLWCFNHFTIYCAIGSLGMLFLFNRQVREEAYWLINRQLKRKSK